MLKIKKSNKFQNDYKLILKDIEKITNENKKQECYSLLSNLIEHLNLIDGAHDITNRGIDPTQIRENVEMSVEIRKKLQKIIKDFKSD